MKNSSPSDPKSGPDEKPESIESEVKADSTSNTADSETLTQNISAAVENNKGSEDSTESKGSPEDSERNRKYLANLSLKEQILFNKENFMRFVQKTKSLTMNWEKIKKYLQEKTYITDLPRNFDTVLHIHDQLFKRTPYRRFRRNWCEDEKNLLIWIVTMYCLLYEIDFSEIDDNHWIEISEMLWNRSKEECQIKWSYLVKSQAQNKPWSKEEDDILKELIQGNLEKISWNGIAKHLYKASGCKVVRLGRHCRERWVNHLNPSLKKGEWSKAEDIMLVEKILSFGGGKWAKISREIRGRTENAVKNRAYQILHSFPSFQNSSEIDFSTVEAKERLQEILNYLQEKFQKEPNKDIAEFFRSQYSTTNVIPCAATNTTINNLSLLKNPPSSDVRQAFCEKIHKEASVIFENQSKLLAENAKKPDTQSMNGNSLRTNMPINNFKNALDNPINNTSFNFSSQINSNIPAFNNQFSLNHNQASYPNGNSETFTNLHFSNILQGYPQKTNQSQPGLSNTQSQNTLQQSSINPPTNNNNNSNSQNNNSFLLNQSPFNILNNGNPEAAGGRNDPHIFTIPLQMSAQPQNSLANQNFLIYTPGNPLNPIQIIQPQTSQPSNTQLISPLSGLPQLQTYLINPNQLLNVGLNNLLTPQNLLDLTKGSNPSNVILAGNSSVGNNGLYSFQNEQNIGNSNGNQGSNFSGPNGNQNQFGSLATNSFSNGNSMNSYINQAANNVLGGLGNLSNGLLGTTNSLNSNNVGLGAGGTNYMSNGNNNIASNLLAGAANLPLNFGSINGNGGNMPISNLVNYLKTNGNIINSNWSNPTPPPMNQLSLSNILQQYPSSITSTLPVQGNLPSTPHHFSQQQTITPSHQTQISSSQQLLNQPQIKIQQDFQNMGATQAPQIKIQDFQQGNNQLFSSEHINNLIAYTLGGGSGSIEHQPQDQFKHNMELERGMKAAMANVVGTSERAGFKQQDQLDKDENDINSKPKTKRNHFIRLKKKNDKEEEEKIDKRSEGKRSLEDDSYSMAMMGVGLDGNAKRGRGSGKMSSIFQDSQDGGFSMNNKGSLNKKIKTK